MTRQLPGNRVAREADQPSTANEPWHSRASAAAESPVRTPKSRLAGPSVGSRPSVQSGVGRQPRPARGVRPLPGSSAHQRLCQATAAGSNRAGSLARRPRETLRLGFAESRAALLALEALTGSDPATACRALRVTCRRAGLEEVEEVLDAWLARHAQPADTRDAV
jgi:hypothetical protein